MKIVGIGDLFIPAKYIAQGFEPMRAAGHEVTVMDWPLNSFDELQAINLKVEQNGADAYEPPQVVFDLAKSADIFVTQFCPVTKNLVETMPKLKAVGVLRAGTENINRACLSERGIIVINTPGRNAECVSDFTIGMMIAEARNIARGHHGLMTGKWIRDYSNNGEIPDLNSRTVGIIGLGAIGKLVARKLSGFQMRLIGYDPYADQEECAAMGIELVSLETLLQEADFVTLHARLTEENRHMIGPDQFTMMKRTAYLINTSRAGLIDENALVNALAAKRIAGAALDVYEEEPPKPGNRLLSLDNVTLTPHMAGGSNDAFFNTPKLLCKRMTDWLKTQYPHCL